MKATRKSLTQRQFAYDLAAERADRLAQHYVELKVRGEQTDSVDSQLDRVQRELVRSERYLREARKRSLHV